jgi:hypothetical protein
MLLATGIGLPPPRAARRRRPVGPARSSICPILPRLGAPRRAARRARSRRERDAPRGAPQPVGGDVTHADPIGPAELEDEDAARLAEAGVGGRRVAPGCGPRGFRPLADLPSSSPAANGLPRARTAGAGTDASRRVALRRGARARALSEPGPIGSPRRDRGRRELPHTACAAVRRRRRDRAHAIRWRVRIAAGHSAAAMIGPGLRPPTGLAERLPPGIGVGRPSVFTSRGSVAVVIVQSTGQRSSRFVLRRSSQISTARAGTTRRRTARSNRTGGASYAALIRADPPPPAQPRPGLRPP